MNKIAVIGIGCAGYNGIRSLRENGYTGEIHAYTDVSHPTANPMLTTYYVSGKIPREAMFPFGDLDTLKKSYDVQLHTCTKVEHIGTADKEVILSDGSSEKYDGILIATGARAVSPPLGQKRSGRCFLMRSVADADQLREMLEKEAVTSATVVGASMVGIKIVELLVSRGIKVFMVDMADRLFPLSCMQETADILKKDLTEKGVELLLKKGVDHIEEDDRSVSTFLTDGCSLQTDILVLCIGTRANTELAANTDVVDNEPVKIGRGIIVDEHMQTNIPGIYAAGDCCEGLNIQTGKTMIIGLWANAAEQGRIAGSSMAGVPVSYSGSIPNNITHYFDQTFVGIGDPNLPGKRFSASDKTGTVSAIYENGSVGCINILGNYRISGMVKDYLIRQITGKGEAMSVSDMGLLRASGVPEEFIRLLGGCYD